MVDLQKAAAYDQLIVDARAEIEEYAADFEELTNAEQKLAMVHTYCGNASDSCACVTTGIATFDDRFVDVVVQNFSNQTDFSEFTGNVDKVVENVESLQGKIETTMQAIDAAQKEIGEAIAKLKSSITNYQYMADLYRGYYDY